MSHPSGTTPSSKRLVITSIAALGVVYGDIGTSPLYAFREAFVAGDLTVDRTSVLGVLSLMVWSLILVVTVKYLAFIMRADNHGEGGILALTALVFPTSRTGRPQLRAGLVLVGLFGTALLYGDGIITPAISVLSAVEGVGVVTPALDPYIIPIAVVIIVGLFSIQSRGTSAVGALFGPVMIVWFGTLAVLGIYRLGQNVDVLAALLPVHAVRFFTAHPLSAFLALGAVFLVVTGSEALYADMGHFGKRPIRVGWFSVVFPALLVHYLGQGALLLSDAGAIDNPFYRMPPSWGVLPLVLLATAATVIASQALITGAYSLTMQAVQLGYLPRVRIDHTSPFEFGQVYISTINGALMAACVALIVGFRSSSALAAAYGVAVTTTMVITTLLLFTVARERWGWSKPAAVALTGGFLAVDLSFFSANIIKIPAGGWLPLVVGAVVFGLMVTWRWGRQQLGERMRAWSGPSLERFITSIAEHPQRRVPGTAVYMVREPGYVPVALMANLRHNEILHETVILATVRVVDIPRVPVARRVTVHDLGEGFHQIVLAFGFMDEPDVPAALAVITHRDFGIDTSELTYFIGRETLIPRMGGLRHFRQHLYVLMQRNAASAVQFFSLPPDRVFEVGMQVEL